MKKLIKNLVASILPQVMNILTNLILPAMIIGRFGSEVNGLISSTKAIVAYVALLGSGIATAITQSLYAPVAQKDHTTTRRMLHAAANTFQRFGLIFCLCAAIIAFIYPLTLDTEVGYGLMVGLMLVMSLSGASEFFAVGRCRALLYADQKTYVCTLIQAASLLIGLLLAILMLWLGVGIVLVQLAISLVYVTRALLLTAYVRRNYPELRDYRREEPDYSAVAKRGDALIHQLSGLAISSTQPLILTAIVGLDAASIYSVYNIVFSGLQSICANLCTAVTPFLGRELALENSDRLRRMYDWVEYAFFTLVTLVYSVSMLLVVPFVRLYTRGADIGYEYPVFASIFTFASAFYILKMPSNSLINAAGHFRETRWRAILEGGLSVGLGILFTLFWGLPGVVVGMAIALGWRCIDTVLYTNRHVLHCGHGRTLFRLGRTLLILGGFCAVQHLYVFSVNSYVEWILRAFVFLGGALAVLLLNTLLFDRATVVSLWRTVRKRKSRVSRKESL